MDDEMIINVVKNKKCNEVSLLQALMIIRHHIDYCIHYNINLLSDPLLDRVLLRRNN